MEYKFDTTKTKFINRYVSNVKNNKCKSNIYVDMALLNFYYKQKQQLTTIIFVK